MAIGGVVSFDFDDTLVKSESAKHAHFFEVARRHHGEEGASLMAKLGGDRYSRFRQYADEVLSRGLGHLRDPAVLADGASLAEEYTRGVTEIIASECEEVPGALRALEALSASGARLYVNSATPAKDLLETVKCRGWAEYFSGIYGRGELDVNVLPAKIKNLKRCAEDCGICVEEVVHVGDGESDRLAASELGCTFVGVRGQSPFAEVVPHLVEDLVEGLPLLQELLSQQKSVRRAQPSLAVQH